MGFEYTIKAIPTEYNGVMFRSRLEATWAAFFDILKWDWEYEPFDLEGWSPDFLLKGAGGARIFCEVKPVELTAENEQTPLPSCYKKMAFPQSWYRADSSDYADEFDRKNHYGADSPFAQCGTGRELVLKNDVYTLAVGLHPFDADGDGLGGAAIGIFGAGDIGAACLTAGRKAWPWVRGVRTVGEWRPSELGLTSVEGAWQDKMGRLTYNEPDRAHKEAVGGVINYEQIIPFWNAAKNKVQKQYA